MSCVCLRLGRAEAGTMRRLGAKQRLLPCSGSVQDLRPARCTASAQCMGLVRCCGRYKGATATLQRQGRVRLMRTMQREVQCSGKYKAAAATVQRRVEGVSHFVWLSVFLTVCLLQVPPGPEVFLSSGCLSVS
jgi:hypothetical protein